MQKIKGETIVKHLPTLRTITAVFALLPGIALAQAAFPSKALTVVVPLAAGGPIDAETRLYTTKLAENTKWQVLVDNRGGAAGTIAMGMVLKAPADGHTLLVQSTGYTMIPALYSDLPFDPIRDFAPVSLMSTRSNMLVVTSSLPAKTVAEYIAFAKANPGKINFGDTGAGGAVHLPGAWLHSITGTQATFVHYKGTGPLLPDLVAGRIHATNAFPVIASALVKAGKLRALGVTGGKRLRLLPDIPAIAETVPGCEYSSWTGLFAAARTPAAIVNRLSAEFVKVAKDPEIVRRLDEEYAVAEGNTPEQFRQYLAPQFDRWRKLVQETGIKLEE